MVDENKIKKTISLNSQNEMREICSYLNTNFGIDHFSYIKCFSDGTHIALNTHNAWLEHVYLHYAKKYSVFYKTIDAYSSGVNLWLSLAEQDSFSEFKQHSRIDYGIVLVQKNKSSCEFYNFATTKKDHKIINFYLNNLNILWQHAFYFKDKGAKLLKKANEDRWILPKCTSIDPNSKIIANYQKTNKTLSFDEINKFHVNENTYLTRTEAKCCYYLAQGKTFKEIAKILDLSTRTVESHIKHSKEKLGCVNTNSLIHEIFYHTNLLNL